MRSRAEKDFCPERRRLLKFAGTVSGGILVAGATATASGCAREQPTAVVVPLEDVPAGSRIRVLVGEHPVELRGKDSGVEARSLWCTHTGCEVRWSDEEQRYLCPCHDGAFDAEGKVVAGPPPRPLPTYPIRVTETEVWLEPEAEG